MNIQYCKSRTIQDTVLRRLRQREKSVLPIHENVKMILEESQHPEKKLVVSGDIKNELPAGIAWSGKQMAKKTLTSCTSESIQNSPASNKNLFPVQVYDLSSYNQ